MNDISPAPASRIKKWCFVSTPIYDAPNGREKEPVDGRVPLPQGAIVEIIGNQEDPEHGILWSEVEYKYHIALRKAQEEWEPRTITGWVKDLYLDEYIEEFPGYVLDFPNQTADPTDAQQYLEFDAATRYKLCGQICVTYILHKDVSPEPEFTITTLLEKWKNTPGSSYDELLSSSGQKDDSTEVKHLKEILRLYGYQDDMDITDFNRITGWKEGDVRDAMWEKLKTHYLLALVRSNISNRGVFGELIPITPEKGRNHWVVVERLTRGGDGVSLYNPFTNKFEEYSITEFYESSNDNGKPIGFWVKRKTEEPQPEIGAKAFGVHIDYRNNPKLGEPGQAEQYIMIENQKKTLLCGEFSVAYILSQSIENIRESLSVLEAQDMVKILKAYGYHRDERTFSIEGVLEYWKIIEPALHQDNVVHNTTTSLEDLKSILRGYGYNNPEALKALPELLPNPMTGKFLPSPGRIKARLKDYFLILGVAISNSSGRLVPRSKLNNDREKKYTAHWVVVEDIEVTGRSYDLSPNLSTPGSGGWVTLYNPFPNTWEGYSYKELIRAVDDTGLAGWGGLWVKRKITPQFGKPEGVASPQAGAAGNRPATHRRDNEAAQGDKLEEEIRKNLGVSSVPSKILDWIRKTAGSDPTLATNLAVTLREAGVVRDIDPEEVQARRLEKPFNQPATPHMEAVADQLRVQPPASLGADLTRKVASAILPRFVARVRQELEQQIGSRDTSEEAHTHHGRR